MGAKLQTCPCWEAGGSRLRVAAGGVSPRRGRRVGEVELNVAEQRSFLLLPPSAAQLVERREDLKGRGGLHCSEELGSALLSWVSGVGESSRTS